MNTNKFAQKFALACATLSAALTLFATPAFAADVPSIELPAVQRTREPGSMVGYEWELPAVQKTREPGSVVSYEWELPAVQRSGKPALLPAVQSAREAARRAR